MRRTLYVAAKDGLYKSLDFGFLWSKLLYKISPFAIDVLANGDLVISDTGRLIIIPYDKINGEWIDQSMIRMTIGDDLGLAACGQTTFSPVICDGMDILALPANSGVMCNCIRDLGPLISRDGGKTFHWIVFDLPCPKGNIASWNGVALRNGKVILGVRGSHICDLNMLKKDRKFNLVN
jgi:hypothetical protein